MYLFIFVVVVVVVVVVVKELVLSVHMNILTLGTG